MTPSTIFADEIITCTSDKNGNQVIQNYRCQITPTNSAEHYGGGKMMTTKDLITAAMAAYGTEEDTSLYQIVRQVAWYSEGKGTTKACDAYTTLLAQQKERAMQSRYYKHALSILDLPHRGYLYMPGYGDHHEFGAWEVPE